MINTLMLCVGDVGNSFTCLLQSGDWRLKMFSEYRSIAMSLFLNIPISLTSLVDISVFNDELSVILIRYMKVGII